MNLLQHNTFDVAVIGGGLAGLSTAISSAKKGASVILFEKEEYPFHKVCGEYISMESRDYLEMIGPGIVNSGIPEITRLQVSSLSGKVLSVNLDPGGFGISRFRLDEKLKNSAENSGVTVMQRTRVENVEYTGDQFCITTSSGTFYSKICTGSFGKKSNLDVKWKRNFIHERKTRLNNFIGVKYHVYAQLPDDTIYLHNFEDGYCGISRIEDNKFCLCYLTTAANLKRCNNSIEELESTVLSLNPHLKKLFSSVSKVFEAPVTISQVSFEKKSLVHDHILMNGDAAGMIPPLCGNGMSMALHSGKIAAGLIQQFLNKKISRAEMEKQYIKEWNEQFSLRMKTGRTIQSLFGKSITTDLFISAMKIFPFAAKAIIKRTHGKPF